MPLGESVLCWDAISRVMFVGYRSGDDVIAEPSYRNRPTYFKVDQWRPLPTPPSKGGA